MNLKAIAALATQESGNPRSREFLCNDFWQNSPLQKIFKKGTINIRILTPEGRLIGTLDRYQQ